jgi:hypothetical protein
MSGYRKPKKHLHREFLYLNHETVINSLSALEAGKVDEIIQKANEAREGGLGASLGTGSTGLTASRKRMANVEEELVRTRTVFSAFDAWYTHLKAADAFGTFDEWDRSVRDSIEVGDTIEFAADVMLTPVHMVFRTFIAFAERASDSGSVFAQTGEELKSTQRTARMMREMLGYKDSPPQFLVSMAPLGIAEPQVFGYLEDDFFVSNREAIEGRYRVVAQVDRRFEDAATTSAVRVLRDVPATPVEIETIQETLKGFAEPASALGVTITEKDIVISAPAVLVHPIAVWR